MERISTEKFHNSMRGWFFGSLYNAMVDDDRIVALTGDLGYGGFDLIQRDFPERFVNCSASEQSLVGIAVGMSLEGLVPLCYTITSFYLRAAETIGLYLDGEQIPVKLVGSGRDQDYHVDGPSHNCTRAQDYLASLNIPQYYPEAKEEIPGLVDKLLTNGKPGFLSLRR